MEKRVFLAIFLCFAVLAIYQAVFAPPPEPAPAPAASATPSPTGVPAATSSPTPSPVSAAAPAPGPQAAKPAAPAVVSDSAAHDIVVETDKVRAVFSSAGATLRSWQLKGYRGDDGGPAFDLVPPDLPANFPRPFTLATDDPAISATLATALYQPSVTSLSLGSNPGTLSFEFRDASGLNARKTFHFQPEGHPYNLTVEAAVDIGGAARPVTLAWGPALGLGYKPDGSRATPVRALLYRNDKVQRLVDTALQKEPHYEGELRYAGVEEQYFLTVALPGSERISVDFQPVTLPVPNDAKNRTRTFIQYTVHLPGATSLPFFLGPKDFDVLHAVDPELTRAIDFSSFGWLTALVVQLLKALKWINGYLGNYGWSIIALTLIINVLIFPLRHRSMVSMKKMQAAQPEIKAIQDRYAKYKVTDPERQKMNQEMMALYKAKGINPAGGCVPMLLTFPILLGFYDLLYSSIELRGAPFMGWIKDLSLHDPYYITPVVMGLTMFWQQKMMPSTADPVQQKMFMVLPLFFMFTFLWMPSGLVLYWLASNVLAIGQQYLTTRIMGTPARVPARAPLARGNNSAGKS
ncbi:MAG TPA: membrane protein insertase YidC [Vicinamibacterales bacterium]|nr:membrane protein insertase YidC [Vicinamibacterales bacterium]